MVVEVNFDKPDFIRKKKLRKVSLFLVFMPPKYFTHCKGFGVQFNACYSTLYFLAPKYLGKIKYNFKFPDLVCFISSLLFVRNSNLYFPKIKESI